MPTKQDAATQTRQRLLEATVRVIHNQGAAALTLDQVAKEAGVSKGGLLHHFPSKESLIEAFLRHLFHQFEQCVYEYYQKEPPAAGRLLRAYIHASYADQPVPLDMAVVLFAQIAQHETLRRMLQEDQQMWHERLVNDGIPAPLATVIRQACDASWTERLLTDADDGPVTRQTIIDELLRLTRL
ncbi:MAG: TetR/AcrR family transcriptional regulator [Chloroflexota bacterium]|nr:TetR/AcrR family transcriptional regulator [Chloroflexota bacterium]